MSIRKVNRAIARFFRKIWWRLGDKYTDLTIVFPDNVKRWFGVWPAIRDDWDFDFHGMYGIIKNKLERLEPCLRDGHLEGGEEHADDIKKVIEALDRLIEDDYDTEALDSVDQRWGKAAFDFVPCENDMFEMVDLREKGLSEEDKEQKRKDTRSAFEEGERKRVEDINFVFNTIRDKHRHWWD